MPTDVGGSRLLLPVFTLTVFANATLLFLIEPMFTKMVLPLLGGSSAVWSTCVLFFQTALLVGYLYAHVATERLGVRRQAALHLLLLVASLLTLPIAVAGGWTPPTSEMPVAWLILLLTASIGAPFLLLSTGAPLLQTWFAHTRHPAASNPYFLYAASNLGSLIALLGYPLLVEPLLRLSEQRSAWSVAYVGLIALTAMCATLMWRELSAATDGPSVRVSTAALPDDRIERAAVSWRDRLWWVLLALVPSSMLLGVTSFVSTDIAPMPLLWVVPLAIYLLTFVITFSRKPAIPHRAMVRALPFLFVPFLVLTFWGIRLPASVLLPLHLLMFLVAAMVCHGELARRRPPASRLTEFYLWVALGGMLGGVFNVLVAPQTFSWLAEYPMALVAACLLSPGIPREERAETALSRRVDPRVLDVVLPLLLGLALAAVQYGFRGSPRGLSLLPYLGLSAVAIIFLYSFRFRPVRLGLGVAAVYLAKHIVGDGTSDLLLRERSFFGVYEVRRWKTPPHNVFSHGLTIHGGQSLEPDRRMTPLAYYDRNGPLGRAMAGLPLPATPRRVAVIGLGIGGTACYGRAGERWTFYEIDPLVAEIARNRTFFTFLSDCAATSDVVLGDARLSLMREAPQTFDLMILDAYSSDAIPVHLITREAFALYMNKLAPGGVLLFHVTNEYLNIEAVLASLVRDAGLVALASCGGAWKTLDSRRLEVTSDWVAVSKWPASLAGISEQGCWRELRGSKGVGVWTDDFSNLLRVVKW